jgi:RNA polymerase sigma-70 factor (ECF subfamily)
VFERYYQELLGFVARRTGDRERAADVVQETYVRVLGMQGSAGALPVAQPRALLFRAARNIVIDQHRRSRQSVVEVGEFDDLSAPAAPESCQPEARLAARQSMEQLMRAINGLPPRCREAFVLFKIDGLTQAEIAERMGISRNMVEKHVIAGMLACQRSLRRNES